MLRVTRKTLLALEAVTDIAYHSRPNPVRAKDITDRQGVPQRYLEQVMHHLQKINLYLNITKYEFRKQHLIRGQRIHSCRSASRT